MADRLPVDGPDVYVCPYTACARFFRKRSRLLVHLRSHTGERPYVCSYEDCLKSYSRAAHLKRHVEFSHGSPEETIKLSWKCPYEECGMLCANKYSLAKHIKRKHGPDVKTFICQVEECGKECKSMKQLAKHERESHSINQFKCSNAECGKVFNCESKLKVHQKVHEGYACSVEGCSVVLKTWSLLRKHVAVEHASEADLVCPICEKKFVNKSNQKMHMKVHLDERPMFQCDRPGCGRVYLDKRNLSAHIRSYHDGKRIPCIFEGCQRTFSCKNKMRLHLPLHDPNRPLPKKKRKKTVNVPGSEQKVKKRRKRQRRKHVAESMCGLDQPGAAPISATDDDEDKVVLSGSESDGSRVHTGPRVHLLLTEPARKCQVGHMLGKKSTPSATITSEDQGRQLCEDNNHMSLLSTISSEKEVRQLLEDNLQKSAITPEIPVQIPVCASYLPKSPAASSQKDNEMETTTSATPGDSLLGGTNSEKDESRKTVDKLQSCLSESKNQNVLEKDGNSCNDGDIPRGEKSAVGNIDIHGVVNGGQKKLKRKYPEATVLTAEAEALSEVNKSLLIEPTFLKSPSNKSCLSIESAANVTQKTGKIQDRTHAANGHSVDLGNNSLPSKRPKLRLSETGDAQFQPDKQVNPRHKGLILQTPEVDECGDFDELMFPRTSPGGACEPPPADGSGPVVAWDIIALSKSRAEETDSDQVSKDKRVKIDIKRCVIFDQTEFEKSGITKTLCVPVEKEMLNVGDKDNDVGEIEGIIDTSGITKALHVPVANELKSEVSFSEVRKDSGARNGLEIGTDPNLPVEGDTENVGRKSE